MTAASETLDTGRWYSSYIISFVIVALVCYIVWLTNFKSDYKK